MSANKLKVIHYKDRRCKSSESVDLKINDKTIVTPIFAPRLKNAKELQLYLDVKADYAPTFLSAYVVRLLDVGKTLYSRLKKVRQTNLLGQTTDEAFLSSLRTDLTLIDPAFEYLYYYANMSRLAHSPFVSRIVRTYATNLLKKRDSEKTERFDRDAEHTNFWTCIYKDANKRMKLIRDTFNVEVRSRCDIFIPPVPLIASPHLLDVAIFMNEKSRAFSQEKKECADYFVLRQGILRNSRMMTTIKEYIESSPSPLTVFKFKDMNLNDENYSLERSAFKSLLMELSFLSQHVENKSIALLESGNQTFIASLSGFAMVSTSFGMDREDRHRRKRRSPFGNWYDPTFMTLRDRDTLLTIVSNNNGQIPCHCPVCTTLPSFIENEFIEYNRKIKKHYMMCREQEMNEIFTAIEKQDALMGFEKLQRSSLKNLTDVVSR